MAPADRVSGHQNFVGLPQCASQIVPDENGKRNHRHRIFKVRDELPSTHPERCDGYENLDQRSHYKNYPQIGPSRGITRNIFVDRGNPMKCLCHSHAHPDARYSQYRQQQRGGDSALRKYPAAEDAGHNVVRPEQRDGVGQAEHRPQQGK